MSCHAVGRAMNSVVAVILNLFEERQISKDTAMRLIFSCRKGVHWCDGNEYEAVEEAVERGYCGLCFKKSSRLSDAFDNDLEYPHMYRVFDAYDDTAAHDSLCPDCKERVIREYKERNQEASTRSLK